MPYPHLIIICPHCNDPVIIQELNCKIFRHAVLKSNGQQIDPHTTKKECENFIRNDMIYGCGKPFQIQSNENGEFVAIVCDYI